jgi:chromosome partitioning protein
LFHAYFSIARYKNFTWFDAYSARALADLVYKPKRWKIPLERVINFSPGLKADVQNFATEVEDRINNFRGL